MTTPTTGGIEMASTEGRVTRHISFTADENAALEKRAARVGMEVAPFIKKEALEGKVKGYPLAALSRHEQDIGDILHAVREAADRPHPDRWLYQADLEAIDDKLAELLEIEKDILELLRRRLK